MARKRMVTRTIKTYTLTLMCADTELGEIFNTEIVLTSVGGDENKLLKIAKEFVDSETVKVVSISHITTEEKLYGMSEDDFIKRAQILPLRTTETVVGEETVSHNFGE